MTPGSSKGSGGIVMEVRHAVGIISLDRPGAIHALSPSMVADMIAALVAWSADPQVRAVLIDHAAGRGFCAGGDIAFLRRSAQLDGGRSARGFFFQEYRLNHLIKTYAKPVVAFMDGITMGGGVGISAPATFRVATENTRLAMPETGIGLFPDVGGGWYLSRMKGRLGHYLGLAGARLDGAECLWAGLATHYLPHDALVEAKARMAHDADAIPAILRELSVPPPDPAIAAHANEIAGLFASDRLEDVLDALASAASAFADATLAALRTKCPLSCKVTLRQLATSLTLPDFASNMAMEYRIASRMVTMPDFAEGVRAVIIDKDNAPRWCAATAQDVSEAAIDAIFAALSPNEEWTSL